MPKLVGGFSLQVDKGAWKCEEGDEEEEEEEVNAIGTKIVLLLLRLRTLVARSRTQGSGSGNVGNGRIEGKSNTAENGWRKELEWSY